MTVGRIKKVMYWSTSIWLVFKATLLSIMERWCFRFFIKVPIISYYCVFIGSSLEVKHKILQNHYNESFSLYNTSKFTHGTIFNVSKAILLTSNWVCEIQTKCSGENLKHFSSISVARFLFKKQFGSTGCEVGIFYYLHYIM